MLISEQQRNQYEREGYMIVPGFLDQEELAMVRAVCDAGITEIEEEMRSKGVTRDRINVLNRKYFIGNPRKRHRVLESLVFNRKCLEVCRATIGDEVFLHNEQFVVKMTDTATSFAWHQDSGYSVYNGGAEKHNPYITFWIALDDMKSENGTISILPFSREPASRELLEHIWEGEADAMVGYHGNDPGDLVEVPAGTLVAFSSHLLHRSGANSTKHPRRSYFIAYTPTLFGYQNDPEKVYSSGEPLAVVGPAGHPVGGVIMK